MDSENQKVLAVGAHPDDVEILCAGTLFLLRRRGCEIHVATMSLGDCGSMELSAQEIRKIRRKEAESACKLLGAAYRYLGFSDCSIYNNDPSNRRTTALLRETNPFIVFTHPPQDYMSDHEATSVLVRNACFYAPAPNFDTLSFTSVERSAHIPYLYYFQPVEGIDLLGKKVIPQFYVDISDSIEEKLEMLACHKSQRDWLRAHHGMDDYLESARRWCASLGQRASEISKTRVNYAEGFRQHLGHSYPSENLLSQLLDCRVIQEPNY